VFVKVGAVLFGSGYVLLAFLRADLVERLGWLTEQQLLDAVAVGQVTLAGVALVDPLAIAVAAASAVLLLRFRVSSVWLVLAGAAIGLA
jgi:chromate transport protein ChrA